MLCGRAKENGAKETRWRLILTAILRTRRCDHLFNLFPLSFSTFLDSAMQEPLFFRPTLHERRTIYGLRPTTDNASLGILLQHWRSTVLKNSISTDTSFACAALGASTCQVSRRVQDRRGM